MEKWCCRLGPQNSARNVTFNYSLEPNLRGLFDANMYQWASAFHLHYLASLFASITLPKSNIIRLIELLLTLLQTLNSCLLIHHAGPALSYGFQVFIRRHYGLLQ